MKFIIKKNDLKMQLSDVVTIAVNNQNKILNLSGLDSKLITNLKKVLSLGDLGSKINSTLLVHTHNEPSRILLVNVGDEKKLDSNTLVKIFSSVASTLKNINFKTHNIFIEQFLSSNINEYAFSRILSQSFHDQFYEINSQKSSKKIKKAISLTNIIFSFDKHKKNLQAGLKHGEAIACGANLTKDLGNLPPNICTPSYLASTGVKLAKQYKMKSKVLNQKEIEKLKMGSFLSVAKGSREAPKFICIEHYGGKKNQKPIVLVGKGITFDAGGISIKPSPDMDEMKYDMCGAATVLGVLKTVGELKLPINLVALIPTCENLPDGNALKPGDIVTSMSGQTIEVLNTDAEGRLILCDALTYAERFNPDLVVDIATLTGACVIALGHHATGLFSNDDSLANDLSVAGYEAHDKAWHMPLWDEYQPQLDSNFADMANIGGRAAGSITAACFLSRFAKKYSWAHLDIAGTAWKSGKQKGGSGRPVPLLSQFLINKTK
jgi:leucyl aminopeptidase